MEKEKEKPTLNPQTTKPKPIEMEKEKSAQTDKSEKTEEPKTTKHVIWDCESSLYDSFELKSFQRQLDSARTLSMPRLSHHHQPQPSKKPSKISRSIHKFFRSVFRPKQTSNSKTSSWFRVEKGSREGVYYVYDTSSSPEAPETVGDFDGLSPDLKSLVRRIASDRFAPASLGISCA